jgi:hypothetical protein
LCFDCPTHNLNDIPSVSYHTTQKQLNKHNENNSLTELRVICETAGECKKHVRSSRFVETTHERSKSRKSRLTKFEAPCIVIFLVSDCDPFTVYAWIPTVRWRQERVGRRENDQYGNYAHSTVHDTFKFLSLNLHVRAVSDIAIYTSGIELPNLHIQGHNCHFPEPSH